MLPSVVPMLATDLPVRVFPGVWELLSFLRLPSQDGALSLPLLSLFLSFIFFPTSFWRHGLLFWVPDVLCRHSEVVLWNFLSVQMFFWWICGGESGLPVLFLCHLRIASPTPVFLPGDFHRQRSLASYSSWHCKELDMTEWLTHTHTADLGCCMAKSNTTLQKNFFNI